MTYQHSAAVTALELDGTGVALLNLVDDVHRAVLRIGFGVGHDGLFFKIAQRGKFTSAPEDGITAEEVTRTGMQLSHDDTVVGQRVTLYDDVADTGLLAFHNTNLDVDGVILHRHLDRCGIEEEIAVIHVH